MAGLMHYVLELWQGLQWQQPLWWWLLPLPLAAGRLQRFGRLRLTLLSPPLAETQRVYRHPQLARLRALLPRQGVAASMGWPIVMGLLVWGLLLAALAQPYRLGEELPKRTPQREIMFLLDSSVSMVLRDYVVDGQRVDRSAMLRAVMQQLIEGLRNNRVGITVFSELSYTLVPLTADQQLLQRQVARLQPAVLTGRRSDVGQALLAVERELNEGLPEDAQRPLIVVMSDVQQSGRHLDPRLVAERLHQQGYTLHTIAIGAATEAAAERDSSGLIYQTTNFALLEQMARRGGGRFFWARDMAAMQEALLTIQRGEQRQVDEPPVFRRLPLYQWPLAALLILLLLTQTLDQVRRR